MPKIGFAEVVPVQAVTTTNGGVLEHARAPRKADAGQENIPNGLLQSGAVVLARKPHGTERAERIYKIRIESAHRIVQLAHASRPNVPQAEVNGEIRANLKAILNQELRPLNAHVRHPPTRARPNA